MSGPIPYRVVAVFHLPISQHKKQIGRELEYHLDRNGIEDPESHVVLIYRGGPGECDYIEDGERPENGRRVVHRAFQCDPDYVRLTVMEYWRHRA